MYNDQIYIKNQMLIDSEMFLAALGHVASFDLTAALVRNTQMSTPHL